MGEQYHREEKESFIPWEPLHNPILVVYGFLHLKTQTQRKFQTNLTLLSLLVLLDTAGFVFLGVPLAFVPITGVLTSGMASSVSESSSSSSSLLSSEKLSRSDSPGI